MIKASEYCAKIFDGTHETPKPTQDGEYLVTSKCLLDGKIDFSSAYKISKEDYDEVNRRSQVSQYDILFSMIGTIGNTYLEESPDINYAIKNIGVFSCRNREKAIFLYYYLQSPYAKKYIERGLDGAVQKFLSLEKMRNFPVPEFSEPAYKAISELRRIDDKISTDNKIIETSEKLMREIYDYWFVQFDFPDENGRPYKSSGGEMVYDETLKREIPKGWRVESLVNCVSKEKNAIVDGPFGTQMKIGDYVESGVPIYEMDQLNGAFITKDNEHYITEQKYEEVKRSTVKNGDIIISKTGTLGLLGLVRSKYEKGIIVSRLAKITPNPHIIGKYALLIYLSKLTEGGYWLNMCGGSTMPILNNGIIGGTKIIMPNSDLYQQFEAIAEPLYEQIYNLQLETQKLASLRDWLLPMLMNGQVEIAD